MVLILGGALTGFLISLLGWQINIISLHRGMQRGPTAVMATGLGAAIADCVLMVAGVMGAQATVAKFQVPMKWAGGLMLTFMALKILFHKPSMNTKDPDVKTRGLLGSFLIGLIVVLGNPAVILIWIMASGMVVAHFEAARGPHAIYIFPLSFVAGAAGWFTILSTVLLPRVKSWGEKPLHILSRVCAVALMIALIFLISKKI